MPCPLCDDEGVVFANEGATSGPVMVCPECDGGMNPPAEPPPEEVPPADEAEAIPPEV